GQYYGHYAAPIPDPFTSFRIEAGRVTLLDAYLFNNFGDNFRMVNVESPDDLIEKAKATYPDIMQAVDTDEPLGFAADARSFLDDDTVDDMFKWAGTTGMAHYAVDGYIYRPAKMGRIFERSPEGEWR